MMTLNTLNDHLCPIDKNPCAGTRCVKFRKRGPFYWIGIKEAVVAEAQRQRAEIKNAFKRFFYVVDTEDWWLNTRALAAVERDPEAHDVVVTYRCTL